MRATLEVFIPDAILICHEVAELLKMSEQAIRDKVYRKQIPFFKVGKGKKAPVRFKGSELNEWLQECSQDLSPRKYSSDLPRKKKAKLRKEKVIDFEKYVEKINDGG